MSEDCDKRLLQTLKRKKAHSAAVELVAQLLAEDRAARRDGGVENVRLRLSETARRQLGNLLDGRFQRCRLATGELIEAVEAGQRKPEDLERAMAATPKEDSIRQVAEVASATSPRPTKSAPSATSCTLQSEA